MLHISNSGWQIVASNFWETELARAGKVFLSINAGCFRLLLPESFEHALANMQAAEQVVVSRGPWPAAGKRDAIEVLFNETDSPYSLHFGVEQVDHLPLRRDEGRSVRFAVYTRGVTLACYWVMAYYRRSARLPDLSPASK